MKIVSTFFIILTLFFSACSSKKVFEPENIKDSWDKYGDIDEPIIDISYNVALLEDRTILSKDSDINITIQDGFRVISQSDGWIISAQIDGNMSIEFIADKSLTKHFELKKTVAGASIKDDILAVLFADNEMALYSISTKKQIFKTPGSAPLAVDSRIANPFFMNDLVLFLTLDGKIVIVNTTLKKKLRTIIVSSQEYFNNIIYFNVIDSKLIAATAYKLLSLSQKEIRVKYEIRNIAYDNTNIYIATKQGEIISLTPDLQVNAKVKFPFAHFLGMLTTDDKLYVLEKEGYMIEMSKDLLSYDIYDVDIEDGYIFSTDKKFYTGDEYISVE